MTTRTLRGLRTMTLALALAVVANGAGAAQLYTITELATAQPRGATSAYRVNSNGVVLGVDSGHAVLFEGGGVTDLRTLTGAGSEVRGLNDAGYVAGWSPNASGQLRGFETGPAGVIPLPSFGERADAPVDLNNTGVAAGTLINSRGLSRAAVWTPDTVMDLGVLPDQRESTAVAINDLSQVAGNSGGHGFIWSQGAGMRDIGTLGGAVTVADINDAGWVTGLSELSRGGPTSAFIYDGVTMTAFGPIGRLTPYLTTAPRAINLAGIVVGESQRDDGLFTAFVYRDGETMELQTLIDPSLGWELRAAYDINSAGQITGTGYINGRQSAFLLTPIPPTAPVPEPQAWGLMILGFGVAGAALRRRVAIA